MYGNIKVEPMKVVLLSRKTKTLTLIIFFYHNVGNFILLIRNFKTNYIPMCLAKHL